MPRGTRPTPPAAWRCAANAGRSCRGWRCAGTVVIGNGWLRVARCFRLVQPRSLPEPRAACVAEGPPTPADGASGAGRRHGDGRPASGHLSPRLRLGDHRRLGPAVPYIREAGGSPRGGQVGDRPRLAGRHIPGFRARTPNPRNRLQSSARPPPRAFARLSTLPSWRDILAGGWDSKDRDYAVQPQPAPVSPHRCQRWPLGLHDGNARW
jgi:hypothetical protein